MAREKEIPAEIWKRACDLKFKQARSNEDCAGIIYREFRFKISHVTLGKRFNELRAQFDEENVGANHKVVDKDRRYAAKLRRSVLGEVNPEELSNKEKLQLMMDDTFVAFKMAQRDADVKKMDVCLTSFSRGALAIAALERMGLEEGGRGGSPVPLPGVKLGNKELGPHHNRDSGAYSLDPRRDAISIDDKQEEAPTIPAVVTLPVNGENLQRVQEMRLTLQDSTMQDDLERAHLMPGVSLGEAREIASQVEGDERR